MGGLLSWSVAVEVLVNRIGGGGGGLFGCAMIWGFYWVLCLFVGWVWRGRWCKRGGVLWGVVRGRWIFVVEWLCGRVLEWR